MKLKKSNNWLSALCTLSAMLLIGCENETTGTSSSQNINLSIENPLRQESKASAIVRSFNPDANPPAVSVNGEQATLRSLGGGQYEVTGTYPSNITVDVVWSQLFESAVLELATVSKSFVLQQGGSYSINAADYITNFDSDRDGDTNLFELKDEQGLGLNPRNSNLCTRCRSDVASHINRISPTNSPSIDGDYDNIWNSSQFKDISGDAWLTSNFGNGERAFRFASMHDDQNLYLFVLRDPSTRAPNTDDRIEFGFSNIDQNQAVDVFNVPDSAFVGNGEDFNFQNGVIESSENIVANVVINSNSLIWEARVDLGSLGLLSDRFHMFIDVDAGDNGPHIWQGVVVLNQ